MAREIAHIAYNYSDYCPTEDNLFTLNWARNWEYILDTKADFDGALKSLSQRQRWFMKMLMNGASEYELERHFYRPKNFKWLIFEQMAAYLNGKI